MLKTALKLCFLLGLMGAVATVRADEPAGYARATEQGIAEFSARNFEEARALFLQAHAQYPNARTLRALGMVEFELRNYVESVQYLEQALRDSVKPLDATRRVEVEKLLETANSYVARITLQVEPETHALLDGEELGAANGRELLVDIGNHVLEFSAPERVSQRRTLKIKGGERETLRIGLMRAVSTVPARADDKPDTQRKDRPMYKNPWLWGVLGVVVAGAAAGTLAAVYARPDAETKTRAPTLSAGGAGPLSPPP
jgi:tetratricopeptide (TPR) repeat protein